MSRNKQRLICLVGTMVLGGICLPALAEATSNPYEVIVERNPFGLKPPPPPAPPPTNEGQATPPAQVEVTGITSILSSKRVLLEIIPGPGKPMLKPILAEGERVESVEVVSINVEKNEVTIKNGPITTNLTFKVAKASPAPAPTAGLNPAAGHPIVVQPTIQTPFSQNPAAAGRNNVIVAGGSPSAPPAVPAVPVPTSPFGTPNPVAPTSPPLPTGADAGFRQIPSRNIRTTTPQGSVTPFSREEHDIHVEVNRMLNDQINQKAGREIIPPLPPTQLTPQ